MFSSWMIGAVWVPTNFRLTPPEVAYLAQSSGATVHIFDRAFPDHAVAARSENPACRLEISIGGSGADDWEAYAAHPTQADPTGRRGSRPSGLVLLHLRHHRASQGGRADAWADGLCRLQPSLRPDAGHHRAGRVAGGGAAVARRRHPRIAAGRAGRRHDTAVRRTAGLRGGLAPGRAAPRDEHVHRADDPDDVDPP